MKLNREVLKSLPKVLLHEHLDGVLRPKTIIELARHVNYLELPNGNAEELKDVAADAIYTVVEGEGFKVSMPLPPLSSGIPKPTK